MKRHIFSLLATVIVFSCSPAAERSNSEKTSDAPALLSKPAPTAASGRQQLPREIMLLKDSSVMVLIPGGSFIYGMNKKQRDSILTSLDNALLPLFELEYSRRNISIPSYYIDKYEVTNGQYKLFSEADASAPVPRYWNGRQKSIYGELLQPVAGIGWAAAEAYARWAGKRLPSEEEWEKAARGTDGRTWPWGNEAISANYNGRAEGNLKPVQVGSYPSGASPYGLMDMAGNVYEMTTGTWGGSAKAMRGGCYLNTAAYTRTTFRWSTDAEEEGAEYLGFRCVADTGIILNPTLYTVLE